MASKPETKVVKKILEMLEDSFPGFYFKTHGGLYQRIGLPDIMGVHRGRLIGIEVKCPGKEDTLTLEYNHFGTTFPIHFSREEVCP